MSFKFVDILDTDQAIQEKVRQWRNQQDVRQWMFNQNIISKEEHSTWLERLKAGTDQKFWVVYLNDTPIGSAYLQHMNLGAKTTEWGFYIGAHDYRSRGLGKMILFQLLEEIFDRRGFKVLKTRALSNNTGAIQLYTKFHFAEEQRYLTQDAREVVLLEFKDSVWSKTKNELRALSQERVNTKS